MLRAIAMVGLIAAASVAGSQAEAQRWFGWRGGIYGPGNYRTWYWHRPGGYYNPGDFYVGWGYRPRPQYYHYGW